MNRLKSWWKRLNQAEQRLSRKKRTVLNLTVSGVLLLTAWAILGYPLPTAELEFRRLERESLCPPSEIQGVFQGSYGHRTVYGVQGEQVVWGFQELEFWPREKSGPTLFPVSEYDLSPNELLFAAADVPEGTASARLDMTIRCWLASDPGGWTSLSAFEEGYPRNDSLNWRPWTRSYQAEGERLAEGGVLFRVPRRDAGGTVSIEQTLFSMLTRPEDYGYRPDEQRGLRCCIEAVFLDQEGGELARAVLGTP